MERREEGGRERERMKDGGKNRERGRKEGEREKKRFVLKLCLDTTSISLNSRIVRLRSVLGFLKCS